MAVLGMTVFVGLARANYQETIVSETVMTAEPVVSVAQIKNMSDNTPVVITGNIVRSLGDDMYLFSDPSGSVVVEIDGNDWRGIEVTEYDVVKLRGTVDRKADEVEVDVTYVEQM